MPKIGKKGTSVRAKVVEGGRLLVPAGIRRAMGLNKGDAVVMELHGDELRVRSAATALRELQDYLRPFAPADGASVADELIAERRAEAKRE